MSRSVGLLCRFQVSNLRLSENRSKFCKKMNCDPACDSMNAFANDVYFLQNK